MSEESAGNAIKPLKELKREIGYLNELLGAYERIANLGREELKWAENRLKMQSRVQKLAWQEQAAREKEIQELRIREKELEREIVQILRENDYTEDYIEDRLEKLQTNNEGGIYADLFRILANIEISEEESRAYWKELREHARGMEQQLGRSVSVRVALMDYMVSRNCLVESPTIIEYETFHDLVQQTIFDDLTGVYNRRYFESALSREFKRHQRHDRPFSLLVFDLDNFKNYNDSFGHPAGDAVLRQVGRAMKQCFRVEDTSCRIGGEEFSVLFPETEPGKALLAVERFQTVLLEETAELIGPPMTISGGISCLPASRARQDYHEEKLFTLADNALYEAKKAGKNKIICAAP